MKPKTIIAALGLALMLAPPALAESYTDARGEIPIDGVPQRVVVFDTGALDTLLALGVQPVGIAGGVKPAYMDGRIDAAAAIVGTVFEPDMEAVFAAAPDLIVIGGRMAPKYDALSRIAPTIDISVPRENYRETARQRVMTLGRIFDRQAEAEALIAAYDAEVEALRAAAPQAGRALVMLTTGGRMSAHGPGSRFGIVFDDYGLIPAATGTGTGNHGQPISSEFIAEANPDWLLVVDRDAARGAEGASARQILDNELVHRSTAWKEGQVLYLDSAAWYLAPNGITAMTGGARQIREAISGE